MDCFQVYGPSRNWINLIAGKSILNLGSIKLESYISPYPWGLPLKLYVQDIESKTK